LIKDLYEKNYFRDIGNIGVIHKGKSILAPGTVYKAGLAQYFPNLQGRTLKSGDEGTTDTTPVLRGRVSVVSVLSSEWARAQCQSFVGVGAAQNPGLDAYLNEAGVRDVAQTVEINVEENMLKHGLVRMFMGSMRRQRKEEDWGKYFLVSRGLSDEIREALAIWNMKVGSVYLVDGMCRIRWAGNGDAKEEEKQSLVRCLKRLVDEQRGVMKLRRQEPTKIGSAASPTAARSVSVAA
jgi:ATPase complex subunit ATP10